MNSTSGAAEAGCGLGMMSRSICKLIAPFDVGLNCSGAGINPSLTLRVGNHLAQVMLPCSIIARFILPTQPVFADERRIRIAEISRVAEMRPDLLICRALHCSDHFESFEVLYVAQRYCEILTDTYFHVRFSVIETNSFMLGYA